MIFLVSCWDPLSHISVSLRSVPEGTEFLHCCIPQHKMLLVNVELQLLFGRSCLKCSQYIECKTSVWPSCQLITGHHRPSRALCLPFWVCLCPLGLSLRQARKSKEIKEQEKGLKLLPLGSSWYIFLTKNQGISTHVIKHGISADVVCIILKISQGEISK